MTKKRLNNKKLLDRLKKITFLCIVLLIAEILYVGYYIIFHRTESLYFDGINALVSNDSYYVTVGSNNNNDFHYEKAKVSKYNLKKEKTFEKIYNVGYNSAYFGVILDNEDIVTVGSYESTEKEHNASIRKALIAKYDEEGEILFTKDFSLLDNSKFTNIKIVDDGYLVTGQSVYKSNKIGSKEGGAVLVKYNKDGELLWSKTYGSNKSSIFNNLIVENNNIYAVGYDKDGLGIICKYDMDGNFITSINYNKTDETGFSDVIFFDGSLYVSGSKYVDSSNNSAFIIEYDLDLEWQKEVINKNAGLARYNKLMIDNHDNIIAIGIIVQNKKNIDRRSRTINYDGIIGKYNSSLEKIGVVTYGDKNADYFTDVKLVDGNYLVVGYSSYEDGSYLSKFIRYSDALKVLGVDS